MGSRKPVKRPKAGTSRAAAEDRRALFVEAYIKNGGNATQAAIAAGFSKRSAHVRGAELVKDRKVFEAIVERRSQVLTEAQRTTQLTVTEVLEDLALAKRFDPRKLYDEKGHLRPVPELEDDAIVGLAGFEVDEIYRGRGKERKVVTRTAKVKLADRTRIRDQAMKHFGLYAKDNAQLGAAAGEAAARAVADALDFNEIEARIEAKLRARANARRRAR